MAPDGSEPLTNRRTGRSPSASERPERVAQVRTRRTAPPAQPAANPSSLPVSRLTRRNESANSFRFNRRVFQHNPPEAAGRAFITAQKWLLVIDKPLTKERRGGRDGGGSSHACTRQPQSSTLEQRIARRPEEASRTEACMVDLSSVRNRRIKARSCNP